MAGTCPSLQRASEASQIADLGRMGLADAPAVWGPSTLNDSIRKAVLFHTESHSSGITRGTHGALHRWLGLEPSQPDMSANCGAEGSYV